MRVDLPQELMVRARAYSLRQLEGRSGLRMRSVWILLGEVEENLRAKRNEDEDGSGRGARRTIPYSNWMRALL